MGCPDRLGPGRNRTVRTAAPVLPARIVTETGVENFTAFLPSELADLEALTREKGIVQTLPAVTEAGFERLRRPAR